jgi:hypothetical protein
MGSLLIPGSVQVWTRERHESGEDDVELRPGAYWILYDGAELSSSQWGTMMRVLQEKMGQILIAPEGFKYRIDRVETLWRGEDVHRDILVRATAIYDVGTPVLAVALAILKVCLYVGGLVSLYFVVKEVKHVVIPIMEPLRHVTKGPLGGIIVAGIVASALVGAFVLMGFRFGRK